MSALPEQDSQGCVGRWLSRNVLPPGGITRFPLTEGLSGVNTSPALHSSANAPTRRAGAPTGAPGSGPFRVTVLPAGTTKAQIPPSLCTLPISPVSGWADTLPQLPPHLLGAGGRGRGGPQPAHLRCRSAALLRVGTCPAQERIARRARQHMSHPRAPGSEEEIPGGRDEAPGGSPRVPWNARFPEAKGGPAALPCGKGLSRLLRRGEV